MTITNATIILVYDVLILVRVTVESQSVHIVFTTTHYTKQNGKLSEMCQLFKVGAFARDKRHSAETTLHDCNLRVCNTCMINMKVPHVKISS